MNVVFEFNCVLHTHFKGSMRIEPFMGPTEGIIYEHYRSNKDFTVYESKSIVIGDFGQ